MPIQLTISGETPDEFLKLVREVLPPMAGHAADPQPAAAPKTRAPKAEKPAAEPAPSTESPAQASSPTDTGTPATAPPSASQAGSNVASTSTDAVPVAEADLMAAANQAVAKIGPEGANKVKAYIAATYQKADGSAGTLKQTQPAQQAALLADLQRIAKGELTL